ncbi:hypothetical protein CsatA_027299 [Cannabis sativa]
MSTIIFTFFSLLFITCPTIFSNALTNDGPTPYLSPLTFFPNYKTMLNTFKIFIYQPNTALAYNSNTQSLFYASLQKSPFATINGEQAHLFFIPFSTSDLSRIIRDIRKKFPYWNRTLGADHFYLSCGDNTTTTDSDRNVLELRKNSIQISCFPTSSYTKFIPHKDITLPPLPTTATDTIINQLSNVNQSYLGYFRYDGEGKDGSHSVLVNQLAVDPDFLVDFEPFDEIRASRSKFCLFEYGSSDMSRIGVALGLGCVPVVISDRLIKDLPFVDVVRWQEIAIFVRFGGGVDEVKHVLVRTSGEIYTHMRGMGMKASKHFLWHGSPQPFDCFNTLIYQLWLRRHTIRYALRTME